MMLFGIVLSDVIVLRSMRLFVGTIRIVVRSNIRLGFDLVDQSIQDTDKTRSGATQARPSTPRQS
jgi:hypothetical protein